MKGLILAGGHGTRLWPITYTQAKQLIPIANKPILFYCIEDLKNAGITDIGIIVGHTPERIKHVMNSVGDGSRWGVKITYIEQDAPRGIAHAVWTARDFIGNDDFVVYLGDNILKGGIKDFVNKFKNSNAEAHILLTKVEDPSRYGIAGLMEDKVISLMEKPKPFEAPSNLGIVGIYGFKSSIFEAIKNIKPSWRNELEITDAIQYLLRSGHSIKSSLVNGWWKDTGKPEDILEANQLVLSDMEAFEMLPINNGLLEDGAAIQGKVCVGKNTVIKEGSFIRGPVVIGDNCVIGPKTYIGPYTSVGNNVEINGGEIECSIILSNCKIDCGKRIVESLIGAGSNITSANGTKGPGGHKMTVGENSQIHL
jgi:glucose-1-phosphate thymidylyltransferase